MGQHGPKCTCYCTHKNLSPACWHNLYKAEKGIFSSLLCLDTGGVGGNGGIGDHDVGGGDIDGGGEQDV